MSREQRRREAALSRRARASLPTSGISIQETLWGLGWLIIPSVLIVGVGSVVYMLGGGHAPRKQVIEATGTILGVDREAESVRLSHGPIPELGWPSMTMTFRAPGSVLQDVAPGDAVEFELDRKRPMQVVGLSVVS